MRVFLHLTLCIFSDMHAQWITHVKARVRTVLTALAENNMKMINEFAEQRLAEVLPSILQSHRIRGAIVLECRSELDFIQYIKSKTPLLQRTWILNTYHPLDGGGVSFLLIWNTDLPLPPPGEEDVDGLMETLTKFFATMWDNCERCERISSYFDPHYLRFFSESNDWCRAFDNCFRAYIDARAAKDIKVNNNSGSRLVVMIRTPSSSFVKQFCPLEFHSGYQNSRV